MATAGTVKNQYFTYSFAGEGHAKQGEHREAYRYYGLAAKKAEAVLEQATLSGEVNEWRVHAAYSRIYAGKNAMKVWQDEKALTQDREKTDPWFHRALGQFADAKAHLKELILEGVPLGTLLDVYEAHRRRMKHKDEYAGELLKLQPPGPRPASGPQKQGLGRIP